MYTEWSKPRHAFLILGSIIQVDISLNSDFAERFYNAEYSRFDLSGSENIA